MKTRYGCAAILLSVGIAGAVIHSTTDTVTLPAVSQAHVGVVNPIHVPPHTTVHTVVPVPASSPRVVVPSRVAGTHTVPPIAAPWATPGHTITSYDVVSDTSQAQPLINQGDAVDYNGVVIAGHNYLGYQWYSTIPDGTHVTVTTGPLAGHYEVIGHAYSGRYQWPDSGIHGPLMLQSCIGPGTGWTYLEKEK